MKPQQMSEDEFKELVAAGRLRPVVEDEDEPEDVSSELLSKVVAALELISKQKLTVPDLGIGPVLKAIVATQEMQAEILAKELPKRSFTFTMKRDSNGLLEQIVVTEK